MLYSSRIVHSHRLLRIFIYCNSKKSPLFTTYSQRNHLINLIDQNCCKFSYMPSLHNDDRLLKQRCSLSNLLQTRSKSNKSKSRKTKSDSDSESESESEFEEEDLESDLDYDAPVASREMVINTIRADGVVAKGLNLSKHEAPFMKCGSEVVNELVYLHLEKRHVLDHLGFALIAEQQISDAEQLFYQSKFLMNGKTLLKKGTKLGPGDIIDVVVGRTGDKLSVKRVKVIQVMGETRKGNEVVRIRIWRMPFEVDKPENYHHDE